VLHSPSQEYRARLGARRQSLDSLNRIDERLSYARLATFGSSVLLAILAWLFDLGFWWLLVPAAAFVWLVRRHDGVLRARNAAQRGIAFYERGLARIESRWPGTGEPGDRFRDDRHVYANDLDLFGRGSLFELLSLARTRSGEEVLAGWLKSPAGVSEIRERQEAVDELAPALDLRERIALAGTDVRAAVHTDRLLDWAESPLPRRRALFVVTWLLTAAALVAIAYAALGFTLWPLGAVVLVQAAVFRVLRDEMHAIVSGADRSDTADFVGDALTHRVRDLDVVADVLRCLELEQFRSSRLAWLRGRLSVEGLPASRAIRRLHRLSETRESTRNAVVLPLGLFLVQQPELALAAASVLALVGPHLALAVDGWRRQHGTKVRGWLDTVAQFEALSSLASYRYEHAADSFPDLLSTVDAPPPHALFEGIQLGHPMLPDASMVRNDVRLSAGTQLLVVSGSNMSGKSTLLRTVGINAVLALAGAPVRAASLRMTPLSIGATLRIQDSLIEGRSRFYAEITRIRELADISRGSVPLLFLLDELFHGTNSHDRLVGAAGVLRSFLDRGAAGLITTHDLALTAVADELAPRAANVHFEDWLEGDEIRFDYRMKPGPVTRSNAIALMRAVGLDVPGPGG
jgi:hypothetical protein